MNECEFLWRIENVAPGPHRYVFARVQSKGSALILCLVFLSALSLMALSALEAAWSGQRMISSYINHQRAFMLVEKDLLKVEKAAWLNLNSAGLEHFLSTSQDVENADISATVTMFGDWMQEEFLQQRCGPLFEIRVSSADNLGGFVTLSARWEVCCESTQACLTLVFTQQRRLWSRHGG